MPIRNKFANVRFQVVKIKFWHRYGHTRTLPLRQWWKLGIFEIAPSYRIWAFGPFYVKTETLYRIIIIDKLSRTTHRSHTMDYHTMVWHTIPWDSMLSCTKPCHVKVRYTIPWANITYVILTYHTIVCYSIPWHMIPLYNTPCYASDTLLYARDTWDYVLHRGYCNREGGEDLP